MGEIAAYGLALFWLAAVLPAAAITCLKRQWLLFGVGWLTGGLLWFVGAASLAPPGSPWARWFYGEERLARAGDPRHGPRWGSLGLASLALAGAVLALGLFGARPSPLLGLGGKALGASVGNGGSLFGASPCERSGADTWACARSDNEGSGTVVYRVKVNGFGCWEGAPADSNGDAGRRRISGCVHLLDYF